MLPYLIAGAIGFVVAKIFEEDEATKYVDGGSVLLAPNGKPSNLTPEQYKLVRTPAFKEWFGDWENDRENSGKLSGITKEPVVFYHSTKSNFLSKKGENIFKNPPFFFSFKKDVSDYIVRIQHQNKKGRVYTKPFFLKYHNTFDLRHVKILKDKELTRLIKKHTFYQTESDIRLFELKLSLSKFSGNTWFLTENEDFQDYIKNKGYDSFVVYEDGHKNIAVFNPNQIKLADGSNDTFDGNNPDIRYAEGGMTYREYADTQFNEEEDRYLPSDYFENLEIKKASKDNLPLIKIKDGLEYRKWDNSFIKVFDNDYLIGFADTKAIQVAKQYQKRGIGLELVTILKEMNPNHRFGSMTPQGFNLMGKYYDTKIANNPDIRYKTGGEVKDLIVLHNINAHQIEEANKIGGLVTPSIAIVKSENSFTDFGSITLIGTKELIDPENRSVKVFAGDVYSPSVPRKLYYVDKRLLDKITNELIKKAYQYDDTISKSDREIYHLVYYAIGSHTSFEEDINRMSFNELLDYYYDKLKIVYIVDKGIKIKVPMKEKKHFLFNSLDFTLTPEQKKRFAPILREYTTESNEKGSSGISKEIKSKVYDLFLEVLNNEKSEIKEKYKDQEQADKIYEIMTDGLDESFEKNIGTRYDWYGHSEYNLSRAVYGEQILDTEKFNQNIKKVFTKQVIEDYKKWLSDFISQFRGSAYFLKGNEKVPYTLDNLVDATSNRIVGQEKNMTFGVNQAKSYGTKRFSSINEIKKNSNKLISKDEMNFIDDKNKEVFFKLSESLKYEYSDTWSKLDSLGRALADYFKGTSIVSALRKNDFKTPSSYQIYLFKDFADELKNSPVDYFEAKYQRAVSLREFKYAVVPKETSKEVIQILLENGLIVKKYQSKDERIQIVNSISNKDKSIKFDNGGEITTYTEFYDNLQIEDGSKYVGQKFSEVFPFLGRRKTPNDFRILLKQYYGIVKRMEEDDYSTKAMKQTDLNKFKSSKSNIDKKKYLAGFYLDSNGIITKFVK